VIEALLALGLVVIVPMGLRLIGAPRVFFPVLAAGSFLVPQGPVAAALAVPWMLESGMLALWALKRRPAPLIVTVGLLSIPIGSFWLVVNRLGVQPMGFSPAIILLTAVHFHFGTFATFILLGMSQRALPGQRLLAAVAIPAPFVLAAGITFSRPLETAAGWAFAAAVGLSALVILVGVVPRMRRRAAAVLLSISAASALPGMAFAAIYAWNHELIDIPLMAQTHGVLNALGFSLCGMLAWTIEARA
jgi:hypothetical protein